MKKKKTKMRQEREYTIDGRTNSIYLTQHDQSARTIIHYAKIVGKSRTHTYL